MSTMMLTVSVKPESRAEVEAAVAGEPQELARGATGP